MEAAYNKMHPHHEGDGILSESGVDLLSIRNILKYLIGCLFASIKQVVLAWACFLADGHYGPVIVESKYRWCLLGIQFATMLK